MILQEPDRAESHPLRPGTICVSEPGPGRIGVQVEACGICHTDLHTVEGELSLPTLPLVPGHQVVGTIVHLGQSAGNCQIGNRVGLAWLGRTCGNCEFCGQGLENLCSAAEFTGYHFQGGYSEYVLAQAAYAYPLDESLDPVSVAPLLCAGIIGYRALKLSLIKPGQRLGLYGFGASAHLTIQIACHWGCEVYVFSRGSEHRRLAESLGAVWTGRIEDSLPEKLHSGIVFAPAGALVPPALGHLTPGGTLALAGIHMSEIPALDYATHLYHEKQLRSVANSTRADGRELLQLAREIPIETQTQTYRLEQANQALIDLKNGRINGAAVLKI